MTNAERAAIITGLKRGHSQVRVAADVAVTIYQVRRVAVEEGLTPRNNWRELSDDRRRSIERLIKSGVNDTDIARRMRSSTDTVRRVRREMKP